MTAINFMKKRSSNSNNKYLMNEQEEYNQFDPIMTMFAQRDEKLKSHRVLAQNPSKSDYVIGKMTVKSAMLTPVNKNPEETKEVFFSKRLKIKNKKEAHKWMKKINKAEGNYAINFVLIFIVDPIALRKALTRMSNRR
jgi:hypothetical protein